MSKNPLKGMLEGVVMVDETYVGGKIRFSMARRAARPEEHKAIVLALVERGGKVRARPIADVTGETLHTIIRHNVKPSAAIQTDQLSAYHGIGRYFEGGHETVNHVKREYVRDVSTNEAEAFFALLKRGVVGSFHSVSKHHLHRYCDEFPTAGMNARRPMRPGRCRHSA